jgi:hypothetical protein
MIDPTSMILADKSTRRHLTSARPHAPIQRSRPPRQSRTAGIRLATAAILRRLANRVEPRTVASCKPHLTT